MLGLYLRAGFKKGSALTPAALDGLQRAPVLWQTFLPDVRHYKKYCALVGWQKATVMHPFYWQVRSISLQLKLLAHPKSPFKLLGLVHLQNRVDEYVDSRVDIPCELVARFGLVYQHRKGLAVDVTVTGTQRGRRVYSATGTYLMQTAQKPGPLSPYKNSIIEPGETAQPLCSFVYSAAMVRRYAWLSGDSNPIHLSTLTAKLFGFKRAIVHGMYSGAKVISALHEQASVTDNAVHIAFKRPIFVPATVCLLTENTATGTCFALVADDRQQNDIYLTGQILQNE